MLQEMRTFARGCIVFGVEKPYHQPLANTHLKHPLHGSVRLCDLCLQSFPHTTSDPSGRSCMSPESKQSKPLFENIQRGKCLSGVTQN